MESSSPPAPHPALLPPGTVVGRWRVVAWASRGVHGAVYRAVQVDKELSPPVALKVALLPRDPRFAREVELLSRMRHPSVPRLWDSGEWQHPSGTLHPFLVMDWVDGVPLYEQGRQQASAQAPRLLAQLARALQAIHAQGAVHRDVKGDNILVRRSDGRAVLTDFGSCNYPGTDTLTPPTVYPGTPAYRSPEAWLLELQLSRDRMARYAAGPADDLFALGVTACRLLTGEYPELGEPHKDERGAWRLESMVPPPALLQVEPPLRDLILRMLSVRPEERGTAAQLAEALEQTAAPTVPPAPPPRFTEAPSATRPPEVPAAVSPEPVVNTRSSWPWLALAAAGVALAVGAWWAAASRPGEKPSVARAEPVEVGRADAGTAGLGDAAASTSTMAAPELQAPTAAAEDTLPAPVPGQARPDSKGRCPHKGQVALNGGCWFETSMDREGCEAAALSGQMGSMFKNKCYMPVMQAERQPNSSPTDKP